MAFLLIFRLKGPWGKLLPTSDDDDDLDDKLHQTFLTFLIHFTNSRAWMFIQIPCILLRYFSTTFIIVFETQEEGFTAWDVINIITDVIFALDLTAAFIHRFKHWGLIGDPLFTRVTGIRKRNMCLCYPGEQKIFDKAYW